MSQSAVSIPTVVPFSVTVSFPTSPMVMVSASALFPMVIASHVTELQIDAETAVLPKIIAPPVPVSRVSAPVPAVLIVKGVFAFTPSAEVIIAVASVLIVKVKVESTASAISIWSPFAPITSPPETVRSPERPSASVVALYVKPASVAGARDPVALVPRARKVVVSPPASAKVTVPALPVTKVWSPVFVPLEEPERDEAPAPSVRTEVFATSPVRVTVPVFTVSAVVRVALVTLEASIARSTVILFGTSASAMEAQVRSPLAAIVVAKAFAPQSVGLAARAVAVAALPVVLPEEPDTLPVTLPVRLPATSPVNAPIKVVAESALVVAL